MGTERTVYVGHSLPSPAKYSEGSFFLNLSTGELYLNDGAWTMVASGAVLTSVNNDGAGVELVSDTGTTHVAKIRSLASTGNGVVITISTSGGEVEFAFDKVAAGWGAPDGFARLNASQLVIEEPASKGQPGGLATLDANQLLVELPEIDSISTLRSSTNIGAKKVFVRGYAADGDGGEGIFYYDSTDTTSNDNGGTIIVDADGKRWKREYNGIVKAIWFGVFGDGADYTTEFVKAANVAKDDGVPLELPSGTIKLSNATTIDLSGISELRGNTIIDVSASTAVPVFSVTGNRMLVASGLALAEGQSTLTVGTGYPIKRGDTIVITSVEPLPNPARTYYYKGSRVIAESYDSTTGALTIYPGVDFAYTSAYVWLIQEQKLKINSKITIRGLQDGAQVGIVATYADVEMRGTLKHFGTAAIRYNTSRGLVTGTIRDAVYSGTGTSYGVSVNDMSDVHIVGATIVAARHAVAAGGGTWDEGDSGGTPGNPAAYPSSYTINGGYYASNGTVAKSYALDAHGSVRSVNITGATVDGGISVAARESTIVGNTINFSSASLGGLYVGSDAASTSWGRLTFVGNTLRGLGVTPGNAAIRISGQLMSANISHNTILTDYGNDADTYSTPLRIDGAVTKIRVANNTIITSNTSKNSLVNVNGELEFVDNTLDGVYVVIAAAANSTRMRIHGNSASNSPAYGLFVRGDGFTGHEVVVSNNVAFDNAAAGIYLYTFDRVTVVGNRCFNNGSNTALSSSARAGIYMVVIGTAHLVGNNCSSSGTNQLYGITAIGSTVTTNLIFVGNETTGNANGDFYMSGVAWKARIGNRGSATLNDYILASNGSSYQFDGTNWVLA